jgi:hypothetical protein
MSSVQPAGIDNGRMDAVNIFRAENPDGRVDVARAVGSAETEAHKRGPVAHGEEGWDKAL